MNIRVIPLISIMLLGFSGLILTIFFLTEDEHERQPPNGVYHAVDDPMFEVQKTLDKAKRNKKLALVILGAHWCHDSTGLAEKFDTHEMQDVLTKGFEVVFIDVGYFEDRRDITQRFSQAHYFATPTVYIVDPLSEHLLNGDTLQSWGAADDVPLEDYVSYFSAFDSSYKVAPYDISDTYLKQIKQFEQHQAQRLMEAYRNLGPSLQADQEAGPDVPADDAFIQGWREVKWFRLKLQEDIQNLYKQAENPSQGQLSMPTYEKFSWES